MKLTLLGYLSLIAFVVTTISTSVYLRDAHDAAIALATPHYPMDTCQSHTIDTVYNFITGSGKDSIDSGILRDSSSCIINQETVSYVYWMPVTGHSEIK